MALEERFVVSLMRRRLPKVFAHASLLVVAVLSGCASASKLDWAGESNPRQAPAPSERLREPARPGLVEGRAISKPASPPPATPGPADPGLVRSAAEAPAGPATAGLETAGPSADTGPTIPVAPEYPIDLTTALRLAEVENPRIAEARQRIGEALAVQQGAMALLLPTLNAGVNYHAHTGNLQRSSGRILKLDEKSLYFGGGSEAYAASPAEVPAVSIFSELTDAIFEPLAAHQEVIGTRFEASSTANGVLLEVAEHYFELIAANADLAVRRESAAQEAEVARLTRAYANAQQGREADAERAATELGLLVIEVREAEEEVAVAAARLAHRLHLDQSVRVRPVAPGLEQVTIVDPTTPLPALIQAALEWHPEIAARVAGIGAAEIRHKQEVFRPLLPIIWLGYSAGGFGGGSNLVKPELGNFGGRTDFDVRAYWSFENLGMGNVSRARRRWAQVGEAVADRSRVIAAVRSEVGAAYAEVSAARQQVEITTRQLASAEVGFREDLERIRNTVGRPIEVVNSLQLLNQARVARIRAVTDYNKAEFRLFVALGSPPPLGAPADTPLPPAPIAEPPLPPLARETGRTAR